ncbi:MAG: hypothetical protein RID09_13400 [Coleofasciculus sp. G1-WW12-02]|uniref:hypothetical protein n=1 Tax=Coleofasciculus sp. G1-WW12-02 TaxID=3068483 RepID=UPI0032FB6F31
MTATISSQPVAPVNLKYRRRELAKGNVILPPECRHSGANPEGDKHQSFPDYK